LNIPNILTVFRLFAALAVGLVYVAVPTPYADWIALGLFVSAAATDYIDGYLARKWNQITNIGRMLDPIADKAIVLVALLVLSTLWFGDVRVMIPIILIVFREVFVSGLREFLGDKANTLHVTKLAKWKTTVQMMAIILLLAAQLFQHYVHVLLYGMEAELYNAVLSGETEDLVGLIWKDFGFIWATKIGLWLLWAAAALTVITGFDYFRKALPILKEI